jgi:Tfp pilus assembly protein PilE
MSPSSRRRNEGFAYLWLLLLVAFMGLSLTIGVQIYSTSVQRDKEAELLAIGHQFRLAIGRYYETRAVAGQGDSKGGDYPATLDDLLKDNRSLATRRHLRRVFVDPMTGKAEWGLLVVGGRIVGVHSLSDKVPIKQDHFEAEDMGFRGKQKYSDWVFTYPSDLLLRQEANAAGSAPPAASAAEPARPASSQGQP